jgi:glutaredoxin
MPASSDLSLYQTAFCPYCESVRGALRRLGVEVEARDINESPERRKELVTATGRSTVPCLRIEDPDGGILWMHESADIIDFLEQHFGN